jgi:hypothetical protein
VSKMSAERVILRTHKRTLTVFSKLATKPTKPIIVLSP